MKSKIFIFIPFLLLAVAFIACEDGDGDADYGFAYLYMPQATSSGGLDNNYMVPSGEGEYTYNFRVKDQKLDIILGVLRSGKLSGSAYTVDIISRPDTTSQIVASGVIADAVALSADSYTLPANINVPSGKNGDTFYMSVPVDVLRRAEFAGKNLITTVAITNPSKYELNTQKTSTVVIIDVDAMLELIP